MKPSKYDSLLNGLMNISYRAYVLGLAIFNSSELFERINALTWYQSTLRAWIDDQSFPANSKILEAGCATGALTAYLAQSGFKPSGIDYSKTMIKRAKRNYSDLEFLIADVSDTPYPDNSFDVVLATSLINIVDDQKKAFNELTRICKKDGKISILVPSDRFTDEHLKSLLSTIGNAGFSAAALKTWHNNAPKMFEVDMTSLFKQAGLKDIAIKSYLQGMVISISGIK